MVTYNINETINERSASLILTATGVESTSATLTQSGAIPTSIEDQHIVVPNIYPNPAGSNIMIKLDGNTYSGIVNYYLYNINGSLLQSGILNASGEAPINVNLNLAPGMYNITLKYDNKVINEKLLIQ